MSHVETFQRQEKVNVKILTQKETWTACRELQRNWHCCVSWKLSQRNEEGKVDPNSCFDFNLSETESDLRVIGRKCTLSDTF